MPKEDQLILVQRIQQVIPDGDTKNYRHRMRCLDWQNVSVHIIKIIFNYVCLGRFVSKTIHWNNVRGYGRN